jgi:hypothetical protein
MDPNKLNLGLISRLMLMLMLIVINIRIIIESQRFHSRIIAHFEDFPGNQLENNQILGKNKIFPNSTLLSRKFTRKTERNLEILFLREFSIFEVSCGWYDRERYVQQAVLGQLNHTQSNHK